ncbi:hypothetical protein L2E82_20279 [Cichorium intybus]|uniref:Uncharacterized protein n=1 Tax=Cichorium intybus TaxID=13427 RepID=A0ACB9DSJ1_CICIN|nr:hypothetical protein L2E82_20279 [Cichorium intybus]
MSLVLHQRPPQLRRLLPHRRPTSDLRSIPPLPAPATTPYPIGSTTVMSKDLGENTIKQKDVKRKVIDKYVGEIEMLQSKHKLRVDQEELETVIPQIGAVVRIVNGAYRGSNARLLSVNTERFCAKVQIEKGSV